MISNAEKDFPVLSIIIPVYNASKYLPGCLDSILSANLEDYELLLIDDGSTDNSLEICHRYEERFPNIRILSQPNCGPSVVRNKGIDESRGEYIAFLDADDYIDSAAFNKTVQLLNTYDAQIWASDFSRIAANGCVLDQINQIEPTEQPITDLEYMIHFLSDGERVWNVWRYIFQRKFLVENGLRFIEGVSCAEDLEYMVRALTLVERPAFFHNPYYLYRAHYGNTLTRRYTAQRVQQLMQNLRLSAAFLQPMDTACAELLRNKLVKEYLLNLALCFEVPEHERKAAFQACAETKSLLKLAKSGKLKAVSGVVSTLGIHCSAWGLLSMKKVKRRIRRQKIENYGRRLEDTQDHGT